MKIGNCKFFERVVIGEPPIPLLVRYIIFRFPAFGVYVHKLCRSDYDRALHDHPWPFVAIILRRGYVEVHNQSISGLPVSQFRKPGSVLLRPAEWRHRIELISGRTAWSLIIVGRRVQRWGFFLPGGWCWWRRHNSRLNICEDEIVHSHGSD